MEKRARSYRARKPKPKPVPSQAIQVTAESAAPAPAEAPPACAECVVLRAWQKSVLDGLGVTTPSKAIERIAQLMRPIASKPTPKPAQRRERTAVMPRDGETIQELERRRRKAEQDAMPSAMF